jgi:hypothetical protein
MDARWAEIIAQQDTLDGLINSTLKMDIPIIAMSIMLNVLWARQAELTEQTDELMNDSRKNGLGVSVSAEVIEWGNRHTRNMDEIMKLLDMLDENENE